MTSPQIKEKDLGKKVQGTEKRKKRFHLTTRLVQAKTKNRKVDEYRARYSVIQIRYTLGRNKT